MQELTYITSRSNPTVQKYAKLSDKKHREREGLFLIEGAKLFCEAVESGAELEAVLFAEGKSNAIASRTHDIMKNDIRYQNTAAYCLSESAFSKISTEKSPDGVICVAKYLDNLKFYNKIEKNDAQELKDEKIMMLYSLRDPGNMGTVIRSAAAFGFDRLIVSADCADPYNSRAMRASMGAFFKMKINFVSDFLSVVNALALSGRRIFCAELREGAVSLDETDVLRSDCFIIGNEGHGIDKEISAACTGSVYIPISEGSESLNAAVAASVLAFVQR